MYTAHIKTDIKRVFPPILAYILYSHTNSPIQLLLICESDESTERYSITELCSSSCVFQVTDLVLLYVHVL